VCDTQGRPLPAATIDFWQNADNGAYWQMDATQPADNLRCQLKVDAQGGFEIVTIQPRPYQIPTDGPVWLDLVEPSGRGSWRPAHFHIIVSAPGYVGLVTELFPSGSDYIDNDTVFGVRPGLIVDIKPCHDLTIAKQYGLTTPFNEVAYDFHLVKKS
jgi:protocatechuate 3,4-dioxygenase beta subunit